MLLLLLISLFVAGGCSPQQPSYVLTAPNVFYIGVPQTIHVALYGTKKPNYFEMELHVPVSSDDTKVIASHRAWMSADNPKLFTLTVGPEFTKLQVSQERSIVYLLTRSKGPEIYISRNTPVNVSFSDGVILIQTDKPIYTPKQTVKIRVVPLGFDFMPSTKMINLIIKNPHGIRVRQWENLNTTSGFISKTIDIGSYALTGNWTIEAFYGHMFLHNVSSKFEVHEYVLPRFSVKINNPLYILPTLDSFTVTGKATYTYGKPVQGTAILRLNIVGNPKEKPLILLKKRIKLGNGEFQHSIKMAKIKRKLKEKWFPEGYRLQIEADVIEKSTGKTERTVENSVYFVTSPYRIEYVNTARYFKPGLPFSIAVRLKYTNGENAIRIPMRVLVEAYGKDDKKMNASDPGQGSGFEWNRDNTDSNGRAEFVINIAREVKKLKIEVKTSLRNIPKEQNAVKDLVALASESKELMKLRQTNKPAKVGTNAACDAVLSSKTVNQLTYLVISHGQIVYSATIKKLLGIITTISFKVTPSMSPSARLLAYYISKETNRVVADSILLEVEDQFPNPIVFKDADREIKEPPSMPYQIKILGTMGTNVGLLGVDQSVYLLSKSNILTAESVFKKKEDLDLGCGAGSGRNSKDVFKNAGMVVLSHDIVVSGQLKCKEEHVRKKRSIEEHTDYCCSLGNKTDPMNRSCYRRLKDLDVKIFNGEQRYDCMTNFWLCCMQKFGRNDTSVLARARSGVDFDALNFDDEEKIEDTFEIQTRQYFPETWINQDLTISYQEDGHVCHSFLSQELQHKCGSAVFPVSLPDTMTTWVVQAMGVSRSTGFGIAKPLHITTFKPFFIYLSMPYSVQRGEEITISATLFNYKNYELAVHIFLRGDERLCSVALPGKTAKLTATRVRIQPQDTISFPITIVPIKFGKIPIEVIAVGDLGDDRVLKHLNVVPEGIEERLTQSYLLDPQERMKGRKEQEENQKDEPEKLSFQSTQEHNNSKQVNKIHLKVPESAIPESISAKVYFTGNMIGQALTNLASGQMEALLQLPDGCGEQNMVRIAPNVYILHYLTQTNQMTPEMEKKKSDYIQEGYIHELNYRKKDGSFALFKGEHIKGSTWLTSFVLKVFCQANKLSGINIDRNDMCQSAKWLIGKQRGDGAFIENSNSNSIQGGVYTSDVTLTAAVVIALKQCQCGQLSEVRPAVQRAVAFIEKKVTTLNNAYSLAITTYALAMVDSPERFKANRKLVQKAIYNPATSSRYWETGSKARNIETAGYAMLAQVALNRLEYAGPIVVWLTKQRSFGGGFVSTADTCVALESIAKYSEQSRKFKLDLRIKMKNRIVRITKNNAFLQQKVDLLEQIGEEVGIKTSGSGVGQMQVDIKYNVPSKDGKRCDFDVEVTATEEGSGRRLISFTSSANKNAQSHSRPKRALKRKSKKSKKSKSKRAKKRKSTKNRKSNRRNNKRKSQRRNKKKTKSKKKKKKKILKKAQSYILPEKVVLSVCAKYRKSGKTGMAIVEVGLVTGFSADEDTLIKLVEKNNNSIQRYEVSDRAVVFYLNQIDSAQKTCVAFHLIRLFDVGIIQSVPVKVYDYYEPDHKCTIFYNLGNSKRSLGRCNGNRCKCTQNMCPEPEPYVSDINELLNEVCNVYNYAIRGKVVGIDEKGHWINYHINVTQIIKQGNSNLRTKQAFWFQKKDICQYPDLQLGRQVFIMGKDKSGLLHLGRNTFVKTLGRRKRFVSKIVRHIKNGECDSL